MRALPARVAPDAVDDLLNDHRRIRRSRGTVDATLFLIREASSLLSSWIVDAATRLLKSTVIWRRDLTHAIRALARRPWSSVSAILMLAAGLAAVASSAGLASTLLFRSISAKYPNDVLRLASSDVAGRTRLAFSEPELERVRQHLSGSAASLAVANLQPVVLRRGDTGTQTLAEVIGGRYFEIIGLDVPVGRPLVEGEIGRAHV